MASLLIARSTSALWLGLLVLGMAWPITIAGIWLVAAALRLAGFRFHRTLLIAGLLPTLVGTAVMSSAIFQQVRIDSASSCATQDDAAVMQSRTSIIPGPRRIRAVVRSGVCDYGFAQGGVVDYVFVTLPTSVNRNMVLRYTSNNDGYSMANPPQVRWSLDKLRVVVPKGSIYALTYKRNRIGTLAIDYDMRPKEDDSSVTRQMWAAASSATILNVVLRQHGDDDGARHRDVAAWCKATRCL